MVRLIDCGPEEFKNKVVGSRLYCFGYGKVFHEYTLSSFYYKPVCIIDNNKYGDKYDDGEDTVSVISVDQFRSEFTKECAIMVCANRYEEILNQIDELDISETVTCYIFSFVLNYTEETHLSDITMFQKHGTVIPRKIHYCWFGGNELPDQMLKNIETWRKNCPDYDIIRWDESNYDVNKNAFVRKAYECGKWAYVSDYVRLDVLHREGGIYLDTDVEMIKSFDSFLGWDFFCGFESEKYVNFGLGYGAKQHAAVLGDILKQYDETEFRDEPAYLLEITCPKIQSGVLEKYGFRMNNRFQVIENMAVYPKDFFSPIGYIREFGHITSNTHSIHQYGLSWMDNKSPVALSRIKQEETVRMVRNRYMR